MNTKNNPNTSGEPILIDSYCHLCGKPAKRMIIPNDLTGDYVAWCELGHITVRNCMKSDTETILVHQF